MNLRESGEATEIGRSPLDAFTGDIQPAAVSKAYQLGMLCVATAMLLLPAIYAGLILRAGYGVYWHATENFGVLHGRGGALLRLAIYLGPIFAGAILILFMVKPFFAPRQKRATPFTLTPDQEPELFEFIGRICALVRAPKPTRVDLDCQVNASASFRRGALSLLGNDIVLTIGMPLVAGFSMRQFAGVLAHEFGHFAQGAGMRFTYLIRAVSFWFMRVVYERDAWDARLDFAAKNSDFRIMIVLNMARAAVWSSRRILWALMMVGNALSCFMLRQMEFDADSYEAKVAGSEAFSHTARRLRELAAGRQKAIQDAQSAWNQKRLPENLPALARIRAGALDAELRERMDKEMAEAKTKTFDTHPCDADRIRAAAALSEPGVFRLEGPASELFRGFDDLSRNVTRHFYAHECELPLDGARLVPPEQVDAELARQQRAQESSRRWFGSIPVLQISLQVSAQEIRDPGNIPNALGRWRDARRRCDALLPDAHRLGEAVSTAHAAIRSAAAAEWLARGRFTFEAKEFNISSDNVLASPDLEAAAILAQKGHHESLDRLAENLAPALQAMRSRIASALLLAAGSAEPGLAALRQEALPLCDALEALDAVWSRVLSIHESWDAVLVLIQNQGNHSSPGEVAALLESLLARLGEHRDAVIEGLRGVRYPFDHARDELSLADYASDFKPGGSAAETHFNGAGSLLQRLMPFQEQSVSTLVRIVEAIEGAHPLAQGFDPSREATV